MLGVSFFTCSCLRSVLQLPCFSSDLEIIFVRESRNRLNGFAVQALLSKRECLARWGENVVKVSGIADGDCSIFNVPPDKFSFAMLHIAVLLTDLGACCFQHCVAVGASFQENLQPSDFQVVVSKLLIFHTHPPVP